MKKLLSIILAIAMVAAMLPAVFAADAFEGYEYVFTRDALGSDDDVPVAELAAMTLETPLPEKSDQWRAATHNYIAAVSAKDTGIYVNTTANRNNSACFAIELKVEQGGTFVPSLVYRASKRAPIIDLYLVKAGTVSGRVNTSDFSFKEKVGTGGDGRDGKVYTYINAIKQESDGIYILKDDFNMYATETADTVESFGNRELQLEGNTSYYLLFRVVGNDERLTSTGGMNTVFKSFKLTYVPSAADEAFDYTEEEYTASDTATVTALAAYGNGATVEDSEVISLGAVEYGKACTVSVKDETVEKEGKAYSFLYWARGAVTGNPNKKVLSTEASFSYMPSEGNNILIAVYEETGVEKSEAFYNYNGQLLADLNTENGKLPALPSMAGFEAPAKKWVQLGTNAEFDAGEDVSGISSDKVFMAKYDAPISNIEITVNGVADTYSYGDTVTCTPSAPEGKVFMYWTKTVGGVETPEIVSMEADYSFSAWESCTVTAVYGDKVPSLAKAMRKIVIGTFAAGNERAIMAEFIGFDDALEKGIMLGERKLAMTTDKNQFTIINDDAGAASVVGYAIVSDGNGGYSIITDGAAK